jgi:broad specificity phosphatase PhoE
MKTWLRSVFLLLAITFPGCPQADDAVWEMLRQGGYVLLIRHAATDPGVGDPPGFRLDDCKTQRNLSDAGRSEARRLGEALRLRRVPVSEVRSSRWCRCLETARLAFGTTNPIQPWNALNSLFQDSSREAEQTRAVVALAQTVKPPDNLVLVTHNVNVRALTGLSPATAEIVVTRSEGGALRPVGRISP